jgi:hypothetical protein
MSMSVRTTSSNETKRSERPHDKAPIAKEIRPPAPKADVEKFREVFAATGRNAPPNPHAKADDEFSAFDMQPRRHEANVDSKSAETMAIAQAGRLAELPASIAPGSPAPAASQSGELAELIEKHVRRMLVSEDASHGGRDGRVILSLADGALAGADLVLSRGESGWTLHAGALDARQAETMKRCAPDLVKRFAASGLGTISIESSSRE